MGRFWFSRRDFNQLVIDIKKLFGAVDSDIDDVDAALTDLDSRLTELEAPEVVTYHAYDPVADETYDFVRDSDGNMIVSSPGPKIYYLERFVNGQGASTGD